jgi:hypothetical protein
MCLPYLGEFGGVYATVELIARDTKWSIDFYQHKKWDKHISPNMFTPYSYIKIMACQVLHSLHMNNGLKANM